MSSTKPVLGYWALRGLGHPIRMVLKYAGVDFEDKLYYETPEGEAEWFQKDKPSLSSTLPYPNLPYYIDGPIKLTQSLAILRHVGAKAGLVPAAGTPEAAAMDVAVYQIVDFRRQLSGSAYNNSPTWDALRETEIPKALGAFEAVLKSAGGGGGDSTQAWISGGNALTIADFTLYEAVEQARLMLRERGPADAAAADASFAASYPCLSSFLLRFQALPAIAAYMAGPDFLRRPFNGSEAAWK